MRRVAHIKTKTSNLSLNPGATNAARPRFKIADFCIRMNLGLTSISVKRNNQHVYQIYKCKMIGLFHRLLKTCAKLWDNMYVASEF